MLFIRYVMIRCLDLTSYLQRISNAHITNNTNSTTPTLGMPTLRATGFIFQFQFAFCMKIIYFIFVKMKIIFTDDVVLGTAGEMNMITQSIRGTH